MQWLSTPHQNRPRWCFFVGVRSCQLWHRHEIRYLAIDSSCLLPTPSLPVVRCPFLLQGRALGSNDIFKRDMLLATFHWNELKWQHQILTCHFGMNIRNIDDIAIVSFFLHHFNLSSSGSMKWLTKRLNFRAQLTSGTSWTSRTSSQTTSSE